MGQRQEDAAAPSSTLSPTRDIVVIGASAGGLQPLIALLKDLPASLPASLFLVVHSGSGSVDGLERILTGNTPLSVQPATDQGTIEPGTLYLAPPDKHLLVKPSGVRLSGGPRENRSRPSIDTLFRSAAAAYGSRTIGILLSGMLDDGVAGLAAIKRCRGIAMVQDPTEAAYPDLPKVALSRVVADYVTSAYKMSEILVHLASQPAPRCTVPADIITESRIAEEIGTAKLEERLGTLVPIGCPECGGPLWEIEQEALRRYRCGVGHAFSPGVLLTEQRGAVENALWVALRALEERANLLQRLADDEQKRGRQTASTQYRTRAKEVAAQATLIRDLLVSGAVQPQ